MAEATTTVTLTLTIEEATRLVQHFGMGAASQTIDDAGFRTIYEALKGAGIESPTDEYGSLIWPDYEIRHRND